MNNETTTSQAPNHTSARPLASAARRPSGRTSLVAVALAVLASMLLSVAPASAHRLAPDIAVGAGSLSYNRTTRDYTATFTVANVGTQPLPSGAEIRFTASGGRLNGSSAQVRAGKVAQLTVGFQRLASSTRATISLPFGLSPGESVRVSVRYQPGYYCGAALAGVWATGDPNKRITESNERNNTGLAFDCLAG
ncbi:MAG: hypothetical protein HKN26_11495 [Acidimicrobiales bacterium]|nr:hypothetical protein [Acidimicrobiales bacterium]